MPISLPPHQPAGIHRQADPESARRAQEYRKQQQLEAEQRRKAHERALVAESRRKASETSQKK